MTINENFVVSLLLVFRVFCFFLNTLIFYCFFFFSKRFVYVDFVKTLKVVKIRVFVIGLFVEVRVCIVFVREIGGMCLEFLVCIYYYYVRRNNLFIKLRFLFVFIRFKLVYVLKFKIWVVILNILLIL